METNLKDVNVITLFVEDPQRSKDFYLRIFDVTFVYEDTNAAAVQFEHLMVNFLAFPAVDELIAPATVGRPQKESHLMFTIFVQDVDAVCEALSKAGVALLNGPLNRAWGMRTASFKDPDGYIWELAKEIEA